MKRQHSTPQSQEIRSRGIGASEVTALLGLDKWTSPLKLFEIKTGKREPDIPNVYTRAGHMLEDAVARYFEDLTGNRVISKSKGDYIVKHTQHETLFCHPDREYFLKGTRKRGVLECKSTQKNVDKDDMPEAWFVQLQFQLGILNSVDPKIHEGAIAWLQRGLNFDFKEFEINHEFVEFLFAKSLEFWNNHILTGIPPEPSSEDDMKRMFPDSRQTTIEATPAMIATHEKINSLTSQIDELTVEKESLTLQVKMAMQDAEAVTFGDETLFTWKTSKQKRVDLTWLRANYPEAAEKSSFETSVRRFLIK